MFPFVDLVLLVEDAVEPFDDVVFGMADTDAESHAALDLVRAADNKLVQDLCVGTCLVDVGGEPSGAASSMCAEGRNDFPRELVVFQERPYRKGVCSVPDRRAEKDNVISVEVRHVLQRRERTRIEVLADSFEGRGIRFGIGLRHFKLDQRTAGVFGDPLRDSRGIAYLRLRIIDDCHLAGNLGSQRKCRFR